MGLKPTRPRQSKATVKEPRLFDGFLLASSPQSSDLATSLATFDEGFGQRPLCGLDEAGRGPLAGPLVAAAVILNPDEPWPGVNDSKKLTAPQREELFEKIVAEALDFSVALKSPQDVDRLNPLAASLEAMAEAYAALSLKPALALVDGPFKP
ncbi:MAG: ribonuclease HII, partial [Deltaproteobacteria bacterium]|nr:ribonuclease HII [Deltaproteobacteria bacterium]